MALNTAPTVGQRVLRVIEPVARIVAAVATLGVLGLDVLALALAALVLVVIEVIEPSARRRPWYALGVVAAGTAYWAWGDTTPVDLVWLPLALASAIVSRLAFERLHLGNELPDSTRPPRPARGLTPQAIAIIAVVLLATLVGSRIDMPLGDSQDEVQQKQPQSSSGGERSGSVGDPARPGELDTVVKPYLGFGSSIDAGTRGELGDDVVLRVSSSAPAFWRGGAYDEWDGRHWTRSGENPSFGDTAPFAARDIDIAELTQTVRVEAPAIGVIFAAPQFVWADGIPFSRYRFEPDGEVPLRPPLGEGAEYTAHSMQRLVTADDLRAHDPREADVDPTGGGVLTTSEIPDDVVRLARRITRDAPTTYDAVRALEQWIGDHTEYTTDIPPLPDDADAVEQFLFVDRKGVCLEIATALTVMLRAIDVPARLGVGFAPGDESWLGGEFTVRESDAHAWTEVWFPGVGWQIFDPTADVPLAGEYDRSTLGQLWRLLQRFVWVFVAIAVGLVAVGVALLVRRARRRRAEPWARRFSRRLERAGRKRGRPRLPYETPKQYVDALGDEAFPGTDLEVVATVLTESAYGPVEPSRVRRDEAEAVLAGAVSAARRSRRG